MSFQPCAGAWPPGQSPATHAFPYGPSWAQIAADEWAAVASKQARVAQVQEQTLEASFLLLLAHAPQSMRTKWEHAVMWVQVTSMQSDRWEVTIQIAVA